METVKKKIIWKIFALYERYCKYRLNKLLPGIQLIIDEYSSKTKSTGTKYPTLYNLVKIIQKKKTKIYFRTRNRYINYSVGRNHITNSKERS